MIRRKGASMIQVPARTPGTEASEVLGSATSLRRSNAVSFEKVNTIAGRGRQVKSSGTLLVAPVEGAPQPGELVNAQGP